MFVSSNVLSAMNLPRFSSYTNTAPCSAPEMSTPPRFDKLKAPDVTFLTGVPITIFLTWVLDPEIIIAIILYLVTEGVTTILPSRMRSMIVFESLSTKLISTSYTYFPGFNDSV